MTSSAAGWRPTGSFASTRRRGSSSPGSPRQRALAPLRDARTLDLARPGLEEARSRAAAAWDAARAAARAAARDAARAAARAAARDAARAAAWDAARAAAWDAAWAAAWDAAR